MIKNAFCVLDKSVRPSFEEIVEAIKEALDFDCFEESQKPLAENICLIIADVFVSNPKTKLKVNGNWVAMETVKEIYGRLTAEHISAVMQSFCEIRYKINYPKAFLKTALYNIVLEYGVICENEYYSTR